MNWKTVTSVPNELGESPFWHPDEQSLYWVDIPARKLCRLAPSQGEEPQTWAMPMEPGSIAPARSGGLVLSLRDGFYRAPGWGGELQRLTKAEHDISTTRFNDGKADPVGRFWAGTMYEPRTAAKAELFSIDCRHGQPVLERKAVGATIANGLAWSPDGATIYWTDTTRHLIRAWDWNATTNAMSRERTFHAWAGKPPGWQPGMAGYGGRPDGAAVDSEGNYWVAMFEGGRVVKLSPHGEELASFAVPALCPTMPCFGGPELKTLYVTTARAGRGAEELARYPDSGCVFSMPVSVPGLPVNFFVD
ncbi:MAG: SMP-30/gluconolactonase/LRE family protein [Pseudomonadota bacterium]